MPAWKALAPGISIARTIRYDSARPQKAPSRNGTPEDCCVSYSLGCRGAVARQARGGGQTTGNGQGRTVRGDKGRGRDPVSCQLPPPCDCMSDRDGMRTCGTPRCYLRRPVSLLLTWTLLSFWSIWARMESTMSRAAIFTFGSRPKMMLPWSRLLVSGIAWMSKKYLWTA